MAGGQVSITTLASQARPGIRDGRIATLNTLAACRHGAARFRPSRDGKVAVAPGPLGSRIRDALAGAVRACDGTG
jgi:hypothetical protein